MTDCFARAALGHSAAPPSIVMKSRRFNPSPRPHAGAGLPWSGTGTNCRLPTEPGGFRRMLPQSRRPGIAAARGGLATSERDERLVAWLIFSRRFLGDFLQAAALDPDQASFSPCRPLIIKSAGAKRKTLVGRPATTPAIDHGSERRARPQ